ASALMSGVTPSFTFDQIRMGSVVVPGPVVKLVITTSSSEIVKARSQPETMAGEMIGRVMSFITCQGRDPTSIAASSTAASASERREWTMVVTKTIEKVMWASVTVV